MQIEEGIITCIGFIGFPTELGFAADGTCFLVGLSEETETFYYLVTARHLVRPINFKSRQEEYPVDSPIHIRLSRETKSPLIIPTIREEWICHPDRHIDVCVREFDYRRANPDGELIFNPLLVDDSPNSLVLSEQRWNYFGHITIGDDIFIPSLFSGHVGERRNIPIVRVGNIAALPVESIRVGSPTVPAYLIETRSLGGISGAPVFLHLDPARSRNIPRHVIDPGGGKSVPYALIGVVVGIHSGQYASDFVSDNDVGTIISKDAEFNAGITVVVPIAHALQILSGDALKKRRIDTLDAIKRESGFKPAGA